MTIYEPLDAALRAATAPGHAEELAGEDAAVAAFRAAAPVPAPRRRPLLARVLTVKTLVIGVSAASTAVVLVVVAGVLPFLPSEEPSSTPPASPSVVTNEGSEPALPLPDSSTARTDVPATPGKSSHPPDDRAPEQGRPDVGPEQDRGHDGDKNDKEDKKDKDVDPRSQNGSNGRTKTPGSPAQGAVTAVPPTGAKPPSQGG